MDRFSRSRQRFLARSLAALAGLAGLAVRRGSLAADVGANALAVGQPSRTALGAATLRAAHQLYDEPRVFPDPLALAIVGPDVESSLRSDPARGRASRFLRALVALRSRHAEDALADAFKRGVRQYLVLGAGLDTFGCRNPFEGRLRVFEVDHPATQRWKRERLAASGIAVSDSLTFAPVDFERQSLREALMQAGFRIDQPAFVSLLGVVTYLSRDAVFGTLRFVAALPAGSEVVFDYGVPDALLGAGELAARRAAAARVRAAGEPWITWFDPVALAGELRRMGFSWIEDLDPEKANARHFSQRADGLALGSGAHVMRARV